MKLKIPPPYNIILQNKEYYILWRGYRYNIRLVLGSLIIDRLDTTEIYSISLVLNEIKLYSGIEVEYDLAVYKIVIHLHGITMNDLFKSWGISKIIIITKSGNNSKIFNI